MLFEMASTVENGKDRLGKGELLQWPNKAQVKRKFSWGSKLTSTCESLSLKIYFLFWLCLCNFHLVLILFSPQEEYEKECVEWSFQSFVDNRPCLDLIEGRIGVFSLMNEVRKILYIECKYNFLQKCQLYMAGKLQHVISGYLTGWEGTRTKTQIDPKL